MDSGRARAIITVQITVEPEVSPDYLVTERFENEASSAVAQGQVRCRCGRVRSSRDGRMPSMEPSSATRIPLPEPSMGLPATSQRLAQEAPVLAILISLAVLMFFSYAPLAQAKTPEQYVLKPHHHCKAQYVKKVARVKVKKHGHTRVVSETICVRLASKTVLPKVVAPITPPGPVVTPPASSVPAPVPGRVETVLHAHIDPSFVQSPTDPYKVTYQYSASATEGSSGTPVANLPEGVLNLFSDGLLACSINVGGPVMGGECTVTYTKLGEHGVIVTYTSGTSNGTETYVEHIEPFPTAIVEEPTTTKASGQVQCVQAEEDQGVVTCKEFGSESLVAFYAMNAEKGKTIIRIRNPPEPNGEPQEALKYLAVGRSIGIAPPGDGGATSGVITEIMTLGENGERQEEEEIVVDHELCLGLQCEQPPVPQLSLPEVWHAHLSIIPETSGPVVKPELKLSLVKGLSFERAHKGGELLEGYTAFYEPKEGFEEIATVSYAGTITEGPAEAFHLTSDHWLPSTSETPFTIAGK
jgi:hypothetical protein